MRNNINRELSDIARDYQASQMKVNEIYTAIGQAYYTKLKGNTESLDEEFRKMFADVEVIIKQQELMETRRKFLNGIVVCTKCKADNNVELSFCACCGTRLPHKIAPVEDGQVRCVNCGNVMKQGQAFCGNCGAKAPQPEVEPVVKAPQPEVEPVVEAPQPVVEAPQPVVEPVAEAPQPIAEEPKQIEECATTEEPKPVVSLAKETPIAEVSQSEIKLSCGNCGTVVNNPEAIFCPNCGNRLSR